MSMSIRNLQTDLPNYDPLKSAAYNTNRFTFVLVTDSLHVSFLLYLTVSRNLAPCHVHVMYLTVSHMNT